MNNILSTTTLIFLFANVFVVIVLGEELKNNLLAENSELVSYGEFDPTSAKKPELKINTVVYPTEIYFGDTLYVKIVRENQGHSPIIVRDSDTSIVEIGRFLEGIKFILTSPDGEVWSEFGPDNRDDPRRNKSYFPVYRTFQPQEKSISAYYLELPAMEVITSGFWKEIELKANQNEEVKCTFVVQLPVNYVCATDNTKDEYVIYRHELRIKPRIANEQKLLSEWTKNFNELYKEAGVPVDRFKELSWSPCLTEILLTFQTMEKINGDKPLSISYYAGDYLVQIHKLYKVVSNKFQYSGGYLKVNGRNYPPWYFTRVGNHKPPMKECPVTIGGWHDLEKSLQPSTMRDEIKLTCMLIEYFDAPNKAEQVKRGDDIVMWLKTLPTPQQMCFASLLCSNNKDIIRGSHPFVQFTDYQEDSFFIPLHELAKKLKPMMTYYHQKQMK
jgi:hypothetical protein